MNNVLYAKKQMAPRIIGAIYSRPPSDLQIEPSVGGEDAAETHSIVITARNLAFPVIIRS